MSECFGTPIVVVKIRECIETIVGRNTTRIQRNRLCGELLDHLVEMSKSPVTNIGIAPFSIASPLKPTPRMIEIHSTKLGDEKVSFYFDGEGYYLNGLAIAVNSLTVIVISYLLRATKTEEVEVEI